MVSWTLSAEITPSRMGKAGQELVRELGDLLQQDLSQLPRLARRESQFTQGAAQDIVCTCASPSATACTGCASSRSAAFRALSKRCSGVGRARRVS